MLYSLGLQGQAPKVFGQLSRRHVPAAGVHASAAVMLIGVILNYIVPKEVFTWVTSISLIGTIWTWVIIMLSHMNYRRAVVEGRAKGVAFRMPGWPWVNWAVIIFLLEVAAMFSWTLTPGWRCLSRPSGSGCWGSLTGGSCGDRRHEAQNDPQAQPFPVIAFLAQSRSAQALVAGIRSRAAHRADHRLPVVGGNVVADHQLDLPGGSQTVRAVLPVSNTLNKTPAETWRQYQPAFEKYSTSVMSPECLRRSHRLRGPAIRLPAPIGVGRGQSTRLASIGRLQCGRHVPDNRWHVCRSKALLHPGSRRRRRWPLEGLGLVLVQQPVRAGDTQSLH